MTRDHYQLFSPGRIGNLALPNRLVRSATWDPVLFAGRRMLDEVLDLYRELALGGVGLIISGGLPVIDGATLAAGARAGYRDLAIADLERLPQVVHSAGTGCKVVAQLETDYLGAGPSVVPSPFSAEPERPLTAAEIGRIVDSFVEGIAAMQTLGFDGVQLHAAHGGLLSRFLSPYTNRRDDHYGGSLDNRVRIVAEIVGRVRERVGSFPLLIKVNGTDYLPGGLDLATFPPLAGALERAGLDAIEVSGGMWDCLARGEAELGFPAVPTPEAHTQLERPENQSYFLPFTERLDLSIPVILVGGNRDVERLEAILRAGRVDFIALCRPLIAEPDLPNRWRAGRGSRGTLCISCNACIYTMTVHPDRPGPDLVRCAYLHDRAAYDQAEVWLATWVAENLVSGRGGEGV